MEPTPKKRKKITKWLIGVATACILIFLGVQNIVSVANALSWVVGLFMPLLVGGAIAIILNVPMSFLEAHLWIKTEKRWLAKMRRPVSYLISLILILGVLFGVFMLIIPELVDALRVLVEGLLELVNKFGSMSDAELSELPFGEILLNIDWDQIMEEMENWLRERGGSIVNELFATLSSLMNGIFDFFISFVFSIYILFNKDRLKNQSKRLLHAWIPVKKADFIGYTVSMLNRNFRNFIFGQSLEAVILGLLCFAGMLIFGFPYAAMISVLVGVTALIPVVGSLIGGAVGAFMIMTEDPLEAVFFVIYLIVLQQLEGNIIYPRVMGSRVKLPGMWILAAVTVGGGIGGPVGMLLSVPIASTLYTLLKEATQRREQAKLATENGDIGSDSAPLSEKDVINEAPPANVNAEEGDGCEACSDKTPRNDSERRDQV